MTFLDQRLHVQAVARVMRGSSLASDVLAALANRSFLDSGQAQRQAVKNLQLIIGTDDFDWPWFTHWHTVFSASRKWPDTASWSWFASTEFTPRMATKLPIKRANAKRELLVSSLQNCAFNLHRLEQINELLGSVPGRVVSLDLSASCKVARKLVKTWRADGSTVETPPFFPGDTTGLKALKR